METNIRKTLVHWFPKAFSDIGGGASYSDYEVLCHFARYTITLISDNNESKHEPFKLILQMYRKGTLYEKNAIENEYLRILAEEEKSLTLMEHLCLMPEDLKAVYIKTILENQLTAQ